MRDGEERQYTRLDAVRALLDPILYQIADEDTKRCAYVHLYGVGLMAALLALKRGYDRQTAELAEIAGMLHDLLCFVDPAEDTDDHAHKCAAYAKKHVLDRLDCLTEEEKETIRRGIYNHSNKRVKGDAFDEIIKDADAVQHSLRNPMEDFFFCRPRYYRVVQEVTTAENPMEPSAG